MIDSTLVATQLDNMYSTLEQADGLSGYVLMIIDGKPVIDQGYGFQDHQQTQRIDARTRFIIASVSKHITAVMVLQLVQEGKLKLTDSLVRYLPRFSDQRVTIHQLLNHTSGLPSMPVDWYASATLNACPTTDEQGCSSFVRNSFEQILEASYNTPLVFEPGTSWAYSNVAYVFLTALLELIEDKNYEHILQERICQPLGLTSMSTTRDMSVAQGPQVHYGLTMREVYDYPLGTGNICSTAGDLATWMIALMHGRVGLTPESFKVLTTAPPFGHDDACGLLVTDTDEFFHARHPGRYSYFTASLDYYRFKKTGQEVVAVNLMNNGSHYLHALYAEQLLMGQAVAVAQVVAADDSSLGGCYHAEGSSTEMITITVLQHGVIELNDPARLMKYKLVRQQDGRYISRFFPVMVTVVQSADMVVVMLESHCLFNHLPMLRRSFMKRNKHG